MRPLDRVPSLKLKLGIVIVGSVAGTLAMIWVGRRLGLLIEVRALLATVIALAVVQVLAHGMTSPLREMAAAARAMARGESGQRVRETSRDEVGDLARAFNSMASELDDVERQRRDLVANVSHELRTPIAALQALLENMADGVGQPSEEQIDAALAQTERLGRLVTQLLDLSRWEADSVVLERGPVGVAELFERVSGERLAGVEAPPVLRTTVEPPELVLDADRERIEQVVANLLDNAIGHSPAGGRIDLEGRAASEGVVLTIADEGPGIEEQDLPRVFERFYRADSARSEDAGGAGLGLAIVERIVRAHGGRVHAEPRQPRGCRMVVELPR